MPRIKEYSSQINAPGPQEIRRPTENDFGAPYAQGLNTLAQGTANLAEAIQKHEETAEKSDLTAKIAQQNAFWTNTYQERLKKAQPGDKNFVQSFMDDYNSAMDKISDGVTTAGGRAHFEQLRAQQQGHFMNEAFQGQAELASSKAMLDMNTTIQSMQTSLITSPTKENYALQMGVLQKVKEQNLPVLGNMKTAELEAKILPQINQSYILGKIRLNPTQSKTDLETGLYDHMGLSGMEKESLIGHAKTGISNEWTDNQRKKQIQAEAQEKENEAQRQDIVTAVTNNMGSVADVANSKLPASEKEHYINWIGERARQGSRGTTDKTTYNNFLARIYDLDPNGAPPPESSEIIQAQINGTLDNQGVNELFAHMNGAKTPEGKAVQEMRKTFLQAVKQQMGYDNQTHMFKDNQGYTNYNSFMGILQKKEQEFRMGRIDLTDLYTPGNKEYLMPKAEALMRSPQEIIRNKNRDAGGDAPNTGAKAQESAQRDMQAQRGNGMTPLLERYVKLKQSYAIPASQLPGPNGEPPPAGFNLKAMTKANELMVRESTAPSLAGQNVFAGQIEKGNIDLYKRPIVNNPDGTVSTLKSTSINMDGKEILIPTISDDGRLMTLPESIEQYKRTGKHLGIFVDAKAATNYGIWLSNEEGKIVQSRQKESAYQLRKHNQFIDEQNQAYKMLGWEPLQYQSHQDKEPELNKSIKPAPSIEQYQNQLKSGK